MRLLNEHVSVVNVVVATEFASCDLCLIFHCTQMDSDSIRLFGFSGACQRNVHGQLPVVWF